MEERAEAAGPEVALLLAITVVELGTLPVTALQNLVQLAVASAAVVVVGEEEEAGEVVATTKEHLMVSVTIARPGDTLPR